MARSTSPTRVFASAFALALCWPLLVPAIGAAASVIDKAPDESQPLHLTSHAPGTSSGSGGASLVRTIVGLAIVIAVIWGITWMLRQVKSGREARSAGSGLSSMATLSLGSGRSLQLVRAGSDFVLLGVAEHGVVPVHRYSEEEARQAGLLELGADNPMLADDSSPSGTTIQMPGQPAVVSAIDRLRRWTVRP